MVAVRLAAQLAAVSVAVAAVVAVAMAEASEALAEVVMVWLEDNHAQGQTPRVQSSSSGPTGMAPPTGHPQAS